ncbi:hypothetical protein CONLIGDRAFT_692388 [Coniochaeta ligniaria NRRL 30616]|uniref:Uncharacterized protein n=1 Tax=Coniochaeta ligniaria NRRL 30616 TaxID=1408157 RepID=A0A1J7J4U8_9PEZI|nr:hypothetical protein CONLIGDRAFT_692388 [Coniochaeta ligniaria NRRL 30616]
MANNQAERVCAFHHDPKDLRLVTESRANIAVSAIQSSADKEESQALLPATASPCPSGALSISSANTPAAQGAPSATIPAQPTRVRLHIPHNNPVWHAVLAASAPGLYASIDQVDQFIRKACKYRHQVLPTEGDNGYLRPYLTGNDLHLWNASKISSYLIKAGIPAEAAEYLARDISCALYVRISVLLG